jgi:hypothetical protein
LGFWVKKPLALIFFFSKIKGWMTFYLLHLSLKKKKGPSACALTKNPFVYTAAAAVKIKRRKYMFGYRKNVVCYSWVPPFTAL